MNKEMQKLISKEKTFKDGVHLLLELRETLFQEISKIVKGNSRESFNQMPFKYVDGYHSKTLAYSIWHIFRIEDIVSHELVKEDIQVLFTNDYMLKINSPIITTGNELVNDEIAEFSNKLNIEELYNYAKSVMLATNKILVSIEYKDLKRRFDGYKEKLRDSKCIDENESWLIDYWCSKDLKGLIQMPFSRHWIMHIEAMNRITTKLKKN